MNAKDNDCFTLAQGPPGNGKTGKTKAIVAGALLTGHIGNKYIAAVTRPRVQGTSTACTSQEFQWNSVEKTIL